MANAEGRAAPAFQEYASEMLAKRSFRLMTATERGIFYTMRLECWANETLPAEHGALAVILGIDAGEIEKALPVLMPFFAYVGEEIRSPELDRYREHLNERHLKLSEGGRNGAAITNAEKGKRRKRKSGVDQGIAGDAATPSATPTACPSATPTASGRPLSTVQSSKAKSNPPSVKDLPPDPFVTEYTEAQRTECSAEAYRRASQGE